MELIPAYRRLTRSDITPEQIQRDISTHEECAALYESGLARPDLSDFEKSRVRSNLRDTELRILLLRLILKRSTGVDAPPPPAKMKNTTQ